MRPKLILPCAGFGTRAGMRPDQSKELNAFNGKPLIEFSLDIAKTYGLEPHVITRKEKLDLIGYCVSNDISIQVLEAPGAEWADTMLQSSPYWAPHNLFMLPDTVFDNPEIIQELMRDLQLGCNVSFGVHEVKSQHVWSTINNYRVIEKPIVMGPGTAWGCFSYERKYGKMLFESFTTKNKFMKLHKASFHTLVNFKDLTRESNIGI